MLAAGFVPAHAQRGIDWPDMDRFWFPEEFRTLVFAYGSSPLEACAAAGQGLSTRNQFNTAEGQSVTCGWDSDLAREPVGSSCEPLAADAETVSDRIEACNAPDSIFFMARGTTDWTSSVRFKLNSSASRQADHLSIFASHIQGFYRSRGWSLPADLHYRIRQGLGFEVGLYGMAAKFSREVGVRPRFNLVLSFGERPPFGLSVEATEGFQRQR